MYKRSIIGVFVAAVILTGCGNKSEKQMSNKENDNREMRTGVPEISPFPVGEENTGYAQYFSGKS